MRRDDDIRKKKLVSMRAVSMHAPLFVHASVHA